MARKGLTAISNDINSRFADNTSGEISPQDIRDQLHDLKDSTINILDGNKYLRVSPYDPSVAYKTGQACMMEGTLIFANKNTTGTFAPDDWNIDPITVDIDIEGLSDIDISAYPFNGVFRLVSGNASENVSKVVGGKVGMTYRFYPMTGLDVTFTNTGIATANADDLVHSSGGPFTATGKDEEGDWIEYSMKKDGSYYLEQNKKGYI